MVVTWWIAAFLCSDIVIVFRLIRAQGEMVLGLMEGSRGMVSVASVFCLECDFTEQLKIILQ